MGRTSPTVPVSFLSSSVWQCGLRVSWAWSWALVCGPGARPLRLLMALSVPPALTEPCTLGITAVAPEGSVLSPTPTACLPGSSRGLSLSALAECPQVC